VSKRITDVVNTNKASKLQNSDGNKDMSVSELASALKALPEYRELVSKLNQHMHIANECMGKYNSQKLGELGELEQTLATGQDEDGKAPKLLDLIEEITAILPTIPNHNKLRLICTALLAQKGALEEEHIDQFFDAASLSKREKGIIDNITNLGIKPDDPNLNSSGNKFGAMFGGKKLQKVANQTASNSEYSSCRYVTNLKTILDAMVNDRLSQDVYPGTQPLPTFKTTTAASVRTRVATTAKNTKWSREKKNKKKSYTGGRQIVFIVGGMSMSELRGGYELMEIGEKEIIMGSTEFLSPEKYLTQLKRLS